MNLILFKTLMMVIGKAITRVLQSSPLERNLVLRFTKGGGPQEIEEGYIDRGERSESGQLNIERFLGLPCSFSFCVWMTWHRIVLDCA
jgi:hypothetical protein